MRIYPELDGARSRSPSPVVHADAAPAPSANSIAASALNVSAAEKLREQMRRDMLADLGGDDEEQVRFGVKPAETKAEAKQKEDNTAESEGEEPDWDEIVSGTKRVLAMKVSYFTRAKLTPSLMITSLSS